MAPLNLLSITILSIWFLQISSHRHHLEERISSYFKEICLKEANISEDILTKYSSNRVLVGGVDCFLKCVITKGGYLNSDGSIYLDGMKMDGIFNSYGDDPRKVRECFGAIKKIESCQDIAKFTNCTEM